MAKVLRTFTIHQPRGPKGVYPWSDWMDGRIWQIKQGVDYNTKPNSMRTFLYAKAAQGNKSLRSAYSDGVIEFQFCDKA